MAIALRILVGLLALVALLFLIGAALPRSHRATSSVTLTRSPADVWVVVRDLGALQGTWSELKSARRLPDQGGREVWEQDAGGFPMRLIVEESAPPARLVTRIDAGEKAAFGGTWTYKLEPAGSGSRLTVTEDGFVGNPLFRVMLKAMGTHRTLDGYLRA
ncbi:MAG TPA: SRPBCC family protein, partial [Gemmatimonadales bacterium]|nr:SRPBCC family protein [Gemmatimonadales bacterium]